MRNCVIQKNYYAVNACLKNLVEILRITKFDFLEYYVSRGGWLWVRFIVVLREGRE